MVSQRRTVRIKFGGASGGARKNGKAGQGTDRLARVDDLWIVQDAIDMPNYRAMLSVSSGARLEASRAEGSPVIITRMKRRKLRSNEVKDHFFRLYAPRVLTERSQV
jgi:hypothetical protein